MVPAMEATTTWPEATITRRVFAAWSITIPASMEETFVDEDGYWHAWDAHRSISLGSVLLTERGKPVRAKRILRRMPPPAGSVVVPPPGLLGWAVEVDTIPPARASRAVQGCVFAQGRALVATVTSEDIAWAAGVWLSIREHDPWTAPGARTLANGWRAMAVGSPGR